MTKHSSDLMKHKPEGEKKSFEELCCAYKTEYPCSSEIGTEMFRGKEAYVSKVFSNGSGNNNMDVYQYVYVCSCCMWREGGG